MNHWSKFKEQSSGYWRLLFLLKVYQFCGKRILQIFLYPIVFFIFLFATRARKCSLLYLKKLNQFSSNPNLPKANYFSVFKHLIYFAKSLSDRIDSWSGNVGLQKLNYKNPEVVEQVLAEINQNKGPFFIASHLGNVEVLRGLANVHSDKKIVVNALTQSAYTPDFNRLMQMVNPDSATNLISATDIGIDSVIMMKEKLQKGEIIVIAADRTAAKNEGKVIEVNFLGQKAHFPVGAFTLASLMESQIYFAFCLKSEGRDEYDFYLYKSSVDFTSRANRKENLQKITQEYVTHLEALCLEYPYQWFNFFDFWG